MCVADYVFVLFVAVDNVAAVFFSPTEDGAEIYAVDDAAVVAAIVAVDAAAAAAYLAIVSCSSCFRARDR